MNISQPGKHSKKPPRRFVCSLLSVAFFAFCVLFFASKGFGSLGTIPKQNLNDYSWAELKAIAVQIERAESKNRGLEIAQSYNLLNENNEPIPDDYKDFTLSDGTKYQAKVYGILENDLANGNGKAGITFLTLGMPSPRRMNYLNTNEGGWEKSMLRKWLNTEFQAYVFSKINEPRIVEYEEMVRNYTSLDPSDKNISTATEEKYWILSPDEYKNDSIPFSEKIYWLRTTPGDSFEDFQTIKGNGDSGEDKASEPHNIAFLFAF